MDLDGKVNFVDGCAMSVDQGKHIGWGKDLISCTLDFINCLKDINMDDTEFAILNAIVLTYPGIQLLYYIWKNLSQCFQNISEIQYDYCLVLCLLVQIMIMDLVIQFNSFLFRDRCFTKSPSPIQA